MGINHRFIVVLPNLIGIIEGKCPKKGAFGHSNVKMCVLAHNKGVFWALFHVFYSICPKVVNIRFCYRFISDLLGINVDFYKLVPNMVIMDKWK